MSHDQAAGSCSGFSTLADEHGFLVTKTCSGSILMRVGFVTMQLPPHALEQLGLTLVRASMKLRALSEGDGATHEGVRLRPLSVDEIVH